MHKFARTLSVIALASIFVVTAAASAAPSPILDYDLTQGTGTTIVDSANGVVATTHGTVWATDPGGAPVLHFDNPIRYWFGDGDWVEVPFHPALNSPELSIEVLVYPMSTGWYTSFAERIRDGGTFQPIEFVGLRTTGYTTGQQPHFFLSIGGDYRGVIAPDDIALHAWSHIVGTYDGNDMRLYVDGALVAEELGVGGPRDTGSKPFYLGHAPSSNHYFNGYYASFKRYDRALTAAEIGAQFNSPPVADANGPYSGTEGSPISLDATGSTDPDVGTGDSIVAYEWDLDNDGAYDDATGALVDGTFGDDGIHTVGLRVTDVAGATDTDTGTVIVANVAPTVASPAVVPEPSDEGHAVTASATFTDPGGDDSPFTCTVDYGSGSTAGTVAGDTCTGAPHVYGDDGQHSVTVSVTDKDGDDGQNSTIHDVLDLQHPIAVDLPSQSVQYSDAIEDVKITASDVADDPLTISTTWNAEGAAPVAGLPDGLAISDDGCIASGIHEECTWTLTGTADIPAATYTVRATVTDDDGVSGSADITLVVDPEDATVVFPGPPDENPVALQVAAEGGASGPFEVSVVVTESVPDTAIGVAAAGDVGLADVSVRLVPVGPGGPVGPSGACTETVTGVGYGAFLTVTCPFGDVGVNTYLVEAIVGGGNYIGANDDVLVVYDQSLGFTTGGGWFYWPGTDDKTNFGYTMKYSKRGHKVHGSLLLVRHLDDGTKYRVKSNALYSLALGGDAETGWASFSGKATYLQPGWEDPLGNHEFVVYVEDRGAPGVGVDRIWLEMRDQAGDVIAALSIGGEAVAAAATIAGGNIVAPH